MARPPPWGLQKPRGSLALILAVRVTLCSPIKAIYLADSLCPQRASSVQAGFRIFSCFTFIHVGQV